MQIIKYRNPAPIGNQQPVFVDGIRTPFVKSFGVFEDCESLELFSRVVDGLIRKLKIKADIIDEIIAGVVIPQTKNPNIARDSILNLGLPAHIHGYTLNRACASSLQSVAEAMKTIKFGHPHFILAGGVECLSDVPIVYSKEARKFLVKLAKARSATAKLNIIKQFKAGAWLPKTPELAEPLTGLTMGQHVELMAQMNGISRQDQDEFANHSHAKAALAHSKQFFAKEILPIWPSPKYEVCIDTDDIIRSNCTVAALSELKAAFDLLYGTITAGNASALTDGAAVGLIADEACCKELGLLPKLRLIDFDFVGVDPWDQLLIGPAITIPRLLKRNSLKLSDIDRFEIHEAFAAQILSCIRAMSSSTFCEKYFGISQAFGQIDLEKLNVNGGAIALGHPFGATGMRLVTTLANELKQSDKQLGVIAICAAGGMAASLLVERIS